MPELEVLQRHLLGGTEENHENSRAGEKVSRSRFEPVTSQLTYARNDTKYI
jgi:hypothetical protein